MGRPRGWATAVTGRPAMRSPGRPPVARREHRQRFWEAIARGATSEMAGVEAGVSPAVGSRWFREAGGVSLLPFTIHSGRYLSFAEREEIAICHAHGFGVREIARHLGRSPSTVSRELRRNAATRGGTLVYRATTAQWHRDRRAARPKVAKLAVNARLWQYVADRLSGVIHTPDGKPVPGPQTRWIGRNKARRADRRWSHAWSPEQISNRLRLDFPDDQSMRISHEAIYQALYIQGRGALQRELVACLRTGRALRVPRARTRRRRAGFVTPEVMISARPAEADDRAVPGHWEGDLIIGLNRSAIGTLVERTTRFTMLLHLPPMPDYGTQPRVKNGPALAGHGAEAVRDAIATTITTLPEQLRRTLTWDRGKELAQHAELTIDTGLEVYFADPYSPWQRGTNENTNGLLRQYFPKGTDLHRYSRDELDAVAAALNSRPRKTLGWRTPVEALNELLLSAQQSGVATTD
ncbi:IS30 family transposase [Nocardia amamiensis]|uniref:IS30 family transposase n=1 Tax=Nocardia amamiensis TaxID=404578 RepID=A0ABS0D2L9_9NOCA|nr:IS30 family transposase [Nocardia amamiensis]MBF6303087.1 IS30 family transposase [Nocardia amamiensis]